MRLPRGARWTVLALADSKRSMTGIMERGWAALYVPICAGVGWGDIVHSR